MDWRTQAACRDENPELFFPVDTSGPALSHVAQAKSVCQRCPVMSECLTWALESGQDSGVGWRQRRGASLHQAVPGLHRPLSTRREDVRSPSVLPTVLIDVGRGPWSGPRP